MGRLFMEDENGQIVPLRELTIVHEVGKEITVFANKVRADFVPGEMKPAENLPAVFGGMVKVTLKARPSDVLVVKEPPTSIKHDGFFNRLLQSPILTPKTVMAIMDSPIPQEGDGFVAETGDGLTVGQALRRLYDMANIPVASGWSDRWFSQEDARLAAERLQAYHCTPVHVINQQETGYERLFPLPPPLTEAVPDPNDSGLSEVKWLQEKYRLNLLPDPGWKPVMIRYDDPTNPNVYVLGQDTSNPYFGPVVDYPYKFPVEAEEKTVSGVGYARVSPALPVRAEGTDHDVFNTAFEECVAAAKAFWRAEELGEFIIVQHDRIESSWGEVKDNGKLMVGWHPELVDWNNKEDPKETTLRGVEVPACLRKDRPDIRDSDIVRGNILLARYGFVGGRWTRL